jgi:hypothetical protein
METKVTNVFETTKQQIDRHVATTTLERLQIAKDKAASEVYSLPYAFLNDSQCLSIIDCVALKFAQLELQDLNNSLNQ